MIDWFKSKRKFNINVKTSYSSPSNLKCGVPQGSTLGLLLFLLYINELPEAVVSDSLLDPDDTCIVFQHKNICEIEKERLRDFSSLCDCFIDNGLFAKKKQNQMYLVLNTNFEMLRI